MAFVGIVLIDRIVNARVLKLTSAHSLFQLLNVIQINNMIKEPSNASLNEILLADRRRAKQYSQPSKIVRLTEAVAPSMILAHIQLQKMRRSKE